MKQFMGRPETMALEWFARLVSLGAAGVAVGVPIYRLTQPGSTVEATLSVKGATLDPGVHFAATHAPILLEAAELPWKLRLWGEAGFAVTWLAIGVGALMVAQVLSTVLAGNPFDSRNPRRIAVIAGSVLVGGMLAPLIQDEATSAILSHLQVAGQVSTLGTFELLPFLVAALIFVVAGAFQRGSQLTADTEGLV
ncbi:DUF2975 domain-containing protein [Tenggerimyces flavus]|uniref:DUF2975 domain-containing protein n=1 Tax=Tenggerimyces flavus TaxID=1708749 RepID=A0ABV7YE42_9ACTN|nr:DUF2975 domain-containing protein [Tenggerimyces flavus]MBM7786925.1 hypothetical protein [Tenggerimyces flavus]